METKHIGNLEIREGDKADYSKLKEVTGYLYISSNVTAELPLLESVGGDLYIYSNATLPLLESVGGDLYIYSTSKLVTPFMKGLKYKSVDGYLFVIEAEKTTQEVKIYSGYNCKGVKKGKIVKQVLFVAEKDGFTAHGETLKKAILDVQFKIVAEKLKKDPINKDTLININYYRVVTGACEVGVRSFMSSHGLEDKDYKAKDLLPILEKNRAYGLEKFKSLLTF